MIDSAVSALLSPLADDAMGSSSLMSKADLIDSHTRRALKRARQAADPQEGWYGDRASGR
jgi:hypothetical protein